MNLADGIADALAYIEENLDGELTVGEIAARAYISEFHFQRVFSAICGLTVGKYVRNRRLTLAARELAGGGVKVTDVAMKYGYGSMEGFSRAFARFHGVSPSDVLAGAGAKSFPPLKPKIKSEANGMEFRIAYKEAFTVFGLCREFSNDTAYQEIPAWWDEHLASENRPVMGRFGVCIDTDGEHFDYLIADEYRPWEELPEGCVARSFDAGDWAVFPCSIATLQDTNTRMWGEWLPSQREYRLRANMNIELYDTPEEKYCELWLPVEKVRQA